MNETAAPEEGARKGGKKRTALIAVLVAIALLAAGIGAWSVWKANSSKGDAGATVTSYEGMTKEEIQADLDRKANESRMTISVAAVCKIDGENVRVNVVNDASNRFSQSFTLKQGGKTLYESGTIKPGETVEWCKAPGAEPGTATITVQAHDADSGKATGNPQAAQVTLVESN